MSRLSLLDSTGYAAFVDAEANFIEVYSNIANIVAGNVSWVFTNKTQADSPVTVVAGTDTYGTQFYTNSGATGETVFNLPAGAAGMRLGGCVMAAQNLKFVANTGETIRYEGSQTVAAGHIKSAVVGDIIVLSWNGTEWIVETTRGDGWNDGTTLFSLENLKRHFLI